MGRSGKNENANLKPFGWGIGFYIMLFALALVFALWLLVIHALEKTSDYLFSARPAFEPVSKVVHTLNNAIAQGGSVFAVPVPLTEKQPFSARIKQQNLILRKKMFMPVRRFWAVGFG